MMKKPKSTSTVLLLMAIMQFANAMDFMIIMPLSVHLIPQFQINTTQFSMLVAAYAFSAFLSSLSASLYADKFDRKHVLLSAFCGLIIATFLCGFANSFYLMLVARILAGMFGGLIGAQTLSIAGDITPFESRGKAVGILMSGFAMASVGGVPIAIYMANTFNWQMPFICIAVIGLILLPFCFRIIPSLTQHISRSNEAEKFVVYKSILSNKKQQSALLLMFTLMVSHFSIIPFLAPYMEKNVGFSKNQLALIYLVGGAVTLFSSPLIGRLADKYGKFRMFYILMVLAFIPVLSITNMPVVPVAFALCVTALFFIFGAGRLVPSQALATSVIDNKLRGSFMNINSSVMQLATGIASFVSGLIVDADANGMIRHYPRLGLFSVSMSIVCIIVAVRFQKRVLLK